LKNEKQKQGAIMRKTILAGVLNFTIATLVVMSGCTKDKATEPLGSQTGTPVNHAPVVPNTPTPADNITGQASTLYLQWHCYDQDANDVLTYSLTYNPGPINNTVTGISGETVLMQNLNANTNYSWQVTASDNHGASSTGPVWHFKTQ
jgi:hypothetical protein